MRGSELLEMITRGDSLDEIAEFRGLSKTQLREVLEQLDYDVEGDDAEPIISKGANEEINLEKMSPSQKAAFLSNCADPEKKEQLVRRMMEKRMLELAFQSKSPNVAMTASQFIYDETLGRHNKKEEADNGTSLVKTLLDEMRRIQAANAAIPVEGQLKIS